MAEWRVLLDETVDPKVATYLQKGGAVAEHVRDALGQEADDEDASSSCAVTPTRYVVGVQATVRLSNDPTLDGRDGKLRRPG